MHYDLNIFTWKNVGASEVPKSSAYTSDSIDQYLFKQYGLKESKYGNRSFKKGDDFYFRYDVLDEKKFMLFLLKWG